MAAIRSVTTDQCEKKPLGVGVGNERTNWFVTRTRMRCERGETRRSEVTRRVEPERGVGRV